MCKITDVVQDACEFEARRLSIKNKLVDYNDLLQEALTECLDNAKDGELSAYYKMVARSRIYRYLKKEYLHGIVINSNGGDRKSKQFQEEQQIIENGIEFASLDALEENLSH